MSKMYSTRTKSLAHLSTYTMETSECIAGIDHVDDSFDRDIHEYVHRIHNCSNRLQAIDQRTIALRFIDQWRLQRLEQLDQRVRRAGQLVLNAFDSYESKHGHNDCSRRLKSTLEVKSSPVSAITTIPMRTKAQSIGSIADLSSPVTINLVHNTRNHIAKTKENIASSNSETKIIPSAMDFGRDFTFETLAHLSIPSKDVSMAICENKILIFSQNSNEIVILPIKNRKNVVIVKLDKTTTIRDLCYIDWLQKALVITDQGIYLLNYRTTKYDIIDSNRNYICGAVDNHRSIFYLVQQSTLYKYDKTSLLSLQADQYPIADGYHTRRMVLDNKTNDFLALLVRTNDESNYILVYSILSLSNGYLYKIVIDDPIERHWICSNGTQGWLIQGIHPNSCFDLNINGLNSVRYVHCNEIRNLIPMNGHERFIVRTQTEIFVLIKYSFVQLF